MKRESFCTDHDLVLILQSLNPVMMVGCFAVPLSKYSMLRQEPGNDEQGTARLICSDFALIKNIMMQFIQDETD